MWLSKKSGKRVVAFIVITGIITMMLFSAWYLSRHGEHRHGAKDCSKESCSICIQLKQADYTLRQLTQLLVAICFISMLFPFSRYLQNAGEAAISKRHDLVALKVRLDD